MTEMCKKNTISVIMLTYNRENFLSQMIECILNQTFLDFEFIIVDNGSTDNSGLIADQYAIKDDRIVVIHRKKGNIGSGRNAGLDCARGEYITFVDDDDFCDKDYLQFLYNLIINESADISICGATWANIDFKCTMNSEEAIDILLQRKNYNVAFPTKMLKRSLFDRNRFLETGKYDDIYLMPKIISEAKKIAYHGLSKYHFNRHDSNNSSWTQNHSLLDLETLKEYLDIYEERTNWLCQRFPNRVDKWNYYKWSFMLSMAEKITKFELTECYEIKMKLINELSINKLKIINSPYLQDFEKNYMDVIIP